MRKLILGLLALLLGLGVAGRASADPILFASTGGLQVQGGGLLYRIDVATQSVTLVGNTGTNRLGGLDFDNNGVLFGVDGGSVGPSRLLQINPNNAAITVVGTIANIQGVDAIAFDNNGVLYAGGWNGVQGRLLTLNPATGGILTNIGMNGSGNDFVTGFAFDASNQLFGSRGNAFGHTEDLVRIDVTNGNHTAIGGATNIISGIWFDTDGTLYGGSPSGQLFRIDPNTGAKTFLFNTGIRISGLTGVTPQGTAVPEPSTFALLGLGALGLAGYGLRRRKK